MKKQRKHQNRSRTPFQRLKAKNTAGAEQTDAASVFFAKARDVLNAPPAHLNTTDFTLSDGWFDDTYVSVYIISRHSYIKCSHRHRGRQQLLGAQQWAFIAAATSEPNGLYSSSQGRKPIRVVRLTSLGQVLTLHPDPELYQMSFTLFPRW